MTGGWERTGPVVVEVDGSAEGLRVIDYACTEAIRAGVGLVLVAPHPAPDPRAVHLPWPTRERVEDSCESPWPTYAARWVRPCQ